MEIKDYNNVKSKHSKLIQDLRSLPKIKAPENFEYNLMTRIHNQNFGGIKKERVHFNLIKFLAPSAVVVTGIILFFIFFSTEQQIDNPFMSEPPAIVTDSQSAAPTVGKELTINNTVTTPRLTTRNAKSGIIKEEKFPDVKINQNDVVLRKYDKYPINKNRSIALDDFISGDSQQKTTIQRGNVVNEGVAAPEFDGFFIRQDTDKDTVAKYRALIDSVIKAQKKSDSLKKLRK